MIPQMADWPRRGKVGRAGDTADGMRSIDQLIDGDGTLRGLARAMAAHNALLERVRAVLPTELRAHCVTATLEDRELHLLADTAAWATRLRYFGRELVRGLDSAGLRVTAVKVRVLPPDVVPPPARHQPARPSAGAVRCVEDSAAGLGDPALRAALERLGRRLRR